MNLKRSFRDFVIDIRPEEQGPGFIAEVDQSDAGEGQGKARAPFSIEAFNDIQSELGIIHSQFIKEGDGSLKDKKGRDIGRLLFETLFQGEVLSLFRRCKERILAGNGDHVLNIRIKYNPSESRMRPFSELPWEAMRDPEDGKYLAVTPQFSLSRYLEMSISKRSFSEGSDFNILFVMPEPDHHQVSKFDPDTFFENAKCHLEQQPHLRVHRLPSPVTITGLREWLTEHECQAVQFIGHGTQLDGEWGLVFEDENRKPEFVSGELFQSRITLAKDVRIVSLVSCETARGESLNGHFNGISHALLAGGIPNVLAMQFPIQIGSGAAFCHAFYKYLAAGRDLDFALTQGRMEIQDRNHKGLEWSAPVLFSRTRERVLFKDNSKLNLEVLCSVRNQVKYEPTEQNENQYTLNLQDFFEGSDPVTSKKAPPGNWKMIRKAIASCQVRFSDYKRISVSGSAWLSIYFALGKAFGNTTGYQVEVLQKDHLSGRHEIWRKHEPGSSYTLNRELTLAAEKSKDLLVAISISQNTALSVRRYAEGQGLGQAGMLHLYPDHIGHESIIGKGSASGLAYKSAQIIQEVVRDQEFEKVHLFIAAPAAFAFFLGHFGTLMGDIQLYEFLRINEYHPSIQYEV